MRILLFNRQFSLYNLGLFESIRDQGKVKQIELEFLFEYGPFRPPEEDSSGFNSFYQSEKLKINRQKLFFSIKLLIQIIQKRYDAIILDEGSVANSLAVLLLRPICNTKLIIWGIGEIPGRDYSNGYRIYSKLLRKFIAKRADSIIAYSEYSVNIFKNWGIKNNRIIKSINVFDLGTYSKSVKSDIDNDYGQDLNNFTKNPFIYYCGAIVPRKQLHILFEAFQELISLAEYRHYRLVISGSGSLLKQFQHNYKHNKILFTGETGFYKTIELTKKSSMVVLPGEGGQLLNIAVRQGVPCICSQADGTEAELIKSGISGEFFENGSMTSLLNMMEKVINNRDIYTGINPASISTFASAQKFLMAIHRALI